MAVVLNRENYIRAGESENTDQAGIMKCQVVGPEPSCSGGSGGRKFKFVPLDNGTSRARAASRQVEDSGGEEKERTEEKGRGGVQMTSYTNGTHPSDLYTEYKSMVRTKNYHRPRAGAGGAAEELRVRRGLGRLCY